MESIIAYDREIQRHLLDLKKFLGSEKEKLQSDHQNVSINQKNSEIGDLEQQRNIVLGSLQSFNKLLEHQPFYDWLSDEIRKKIMDFARKDYTKSIYLEDYIYLVQGLGKLDTSHFSKRVFRFFAEDYNDFFRYESLMEAWRDFLTSDFNEDYLLLLTILDFISTQFTYIYLTIYYKYGGNIKDIEIDKSLDEVQLTQLRKKLGKEIEDYLNRDLNDLIKILKEKSKRYFDQFRFHE